MHRALARSLSSRAIAVISPRDGRVFAEIADASAAEVDAAVSRAATCARSPWARPESVDVRSASLRALAAAIRRETSRLAEL